MSLMLKYFFVLKKRRERCKFKPMGPLLWAELVDLSVGKLTQDASNVGRAFEMSPEAVGFPEKATFMVIARFLRLADSSSGHKEAGTKEPRATPSLTFLL